MERAIKKKGAGEFFKGKEDNDLLGSKMTDVLDRE